MMWKLTFGSGTRTILENAAEDTYAWSNVLLNFLQIGGMGQILKAQNFTDVIRIKRCVEKLPAGNLSYSDQCWVFNYVWQHLTRQEVLLLEIQGLNSKHLSLTQLTWRNWMWDLGSLMMQFISTCTKETLLASAAKTLPYPGSIPEMSCTQVTVTQLLERQHANKYSLSDLIFGWLSMGAFYKGWEVHSAMLMWVRILQVQNWDAFPGSTWSAF